MYVTGTLPFGATTLASKFTMRSPEIVPDCPPIPCAVWHTEHEKPALMCRACSVKLLFARMVARLWHLAHSAYGPAGLVSGFGNRLLIVCPGAAAWLNS